jgi:hypothetical protein
MQRLYLRDGQVYTVTNEPPPRPKKPQTNAEVSMSSTLIGWVSNVWMQLIFGLIGVIGLVGIKRQRN